MDYMFIYFKPNNGKLRIGSPLIKDLETRIYLDLWVFLLIVFLG